MQAIYKILNLFFFIFCESVQEIFLGNFLENLNIQGI